MNAILFRDLARRGRM